MDWGNGRDSVKGAQYAQQGFILLAAIAATLQMVGYQGHCLGRICSGQGHLDKAAYLFKTVVTSDLFFMGGQNGAHHTLDLGGFHFHQTLHYRV
jgi:hypothetical protein